jgi:ribonuclease-3
MVNNRTQSVVCDDLAIPEFAAFANPKQHDLKIKDRADLLEALLGALYVDKERMQHQIKCQFIFIFINYLHN